MRCSSLLAALALVVAPGVGLAQRAYPLDAGARVRFWSGREQLFAGNGKVVARDGDTITLRPDHCLQPCRPLRFTLDEIDSIDVRTGRSRATGAGIGGAIGLFTGLGLVAASSRKTCENNGSWEGLGCGLGQRLQGVFSVAAVVGATVLGAGLGAIIGAGSQWRRLPLGASAPRVSIAPGARGGMTVGVRLPLDLAASTRR